MQIRWKTLPWHGAGPGLLGHRVYLEILRYDVTMDIDGNTISIGSPDILMVVSDQMLVLRNSD